MDRRGFLVRVGAVAGTLSLAGCLEGDGVMVGTLLDEGLVTDGAESGADETVRNGPSQRAIARGVSETNKAALALDTATGGIDDGDGDEDAIEEVFDRLESAREYVAAAADEGDESVQADVDAIATHVDLLWAMAEGVEALTDDALLETLEHEESSRENGADETAMANVEAHLETLGEYRASLADALAAHEDADRDRMEDQRVAEIDAVRDGARRLLEAFDAVDVLGDSLNATETGLDRLGQGHDAVAAQEYESAREYFEKAESAFDEAATTIESVAGDVPAAVLDHVETAYCRNVHLAAAASAFGDGAAAAAAGDWHGAEEHEATGEALIEEAETCG